MPAQAPAAASPLAVKAIVLHASYCRADADVFIVSLKLKLDVTNSSKSAAYLLWPMAPWVARVAADVAKADSGQFLFEQTASHYPQASTHFIRLKIAPGRKVTVRSGYDLIARHDPAFFLPKSVSAGRYAVVLMFKPEEQPPPELQGLDTVESISTGPFPVSVPTHPKLVACGTEEKTR